MASDQENTPKMLAEPGTVLMIKITGVPEQLKCSLVGVEENSSLVVRLPLTVSETWKLSDQTGCVVRFLSQGTVYGFKSHILGKYVKDPLRFLFLAFPDDLEVHNLRNSQRITCHLPGSLKVGQKSLDGLIQDMGTGGISFVHKLASPEADVPSMHLEQKVILVCSLWGMQGEQQINCQVRNFNLDNDSLTVGMSFTGDNGEILDLIQEHVSRVQSLLLDEGHPAG
jgi:c-di-GMP-binding flagellar brake protein YcgR